VGRDLGLDAGHRQPNRLPLAVRIRIVLKGVGAGSPYAYTTKIFLPIQQPLSFGIPK